MSEINQDGRHEFRQDRLSLPMVCCEVDQCLQPPSAEIHNIITGRNFEETEWEFRAALAALDCMNFDTDMETVKDDAAEIAVRIAAIYAAREQVVEGMAEALERIARWFNGFPLAKTRDGKFVNYGVAYGNNGGRDHMREVARAARRDADEPALREAVDDIYLLLGLLEAATTDHLSKKVQNKC